MEAGGPTSHPTDEELARRIDDQTARKFDEKVTCREIAPETLPADADNLAGLVEVLLRQYLCHDATDLCHDGAVPARRGWLERPQSEKSGRLPRYHLLLYGSTEASGVPSRTGIVFLATENRTSTTAALRRMTKTEPPDHVFLVSDERQPLALGDKGQEYLDSLRSRGRERFQDIELSLGEYAELDALEEVIGDRARATSKGIGLVDNKPSASVRRMPFVRTAGRTDIKAPPVGHAHRGG